MSLSPAVTDALLGAGATPDMIDDINRRIAVPEPERHPRKGSKWRAKQFEALCSRDGPHCQECHCEHRTIWREAGVYVTSFEEGWRYTKVNPSSGLEVDHRIPLSEGGSNDLDNLWLLCRDCHKSKTTAERSTRLKKIFADWRAARAA